MAKKKMTLDGLAAMTKRGFDGVHSELHSEVGGLRKETGELRKEMNERFDKIENIVMANYDRRFERVEDNIRLIKTVLKMR